MPVLRSPNAVVGWASVPVQTGAGPAHMRASTPDTPHPIPPAKPRGVSARAILLGALLVPCNTYWIVKQERVLFGPYVSTISLFANVVFVLFALVGFNALFRRIAPRLVLQQGELLTLYTMLAISTGMAGLDGVSLLNQIIPHGAWFGKQNGWSFLDSFPSWLVVRDREALRGHYLGHTTFNTWQTVSVWLTPMLAWTGFFVLLLFTANCINVLVRRQWADYERLTFPIILLPLQMTDPNPRSGFFRNKLMWAGFALAATLSLWNGIAYLYPQVPGIKVDVNDLRPLFTTKPWTGIDWFPITFYPLAIGLSFLLPVDLLFSCWFFFLFWKMQMVVSNAMAWDVTPDFPFIKEQGFGSVVGLFVFYLYTGRKTYAAIWRSAIGRGEETDRHAGKEALSDRGALAGLALGFGGLCAFWMLAGAQWWVAVAWFGIYLATITVITRIRAELGPPVHDFHFIGPDAMLTRMFGTTGLRQHDMAFFTMSYSMTRAHRGDTMPVGLEGLQMAHARQLQARRMLVAILLATALAVLSTFWAFEHQGYQLGVTAKFNSNSGHAQEAFNRMNNWVAGSLDNKPNLQASTAMGLGFFTTLGLFFMRLRFFGFPFHPIGYAISSSWSIHLLWVPMLIAWTLKVITMRYGGLRFYRIVLPFFLGLVLGDCVMGSIWALASLLMGTPTYNFFGA